MSLTWKSCLTKFQRHSWIKSTSLPSYITCSVRSTSSIPPISFIETLSHLIYSSPLIVMLRSVISVLPVLCQSIQLHKRVWNNTEKLNIRACKRLDACLIECLSKINSIKTYPHIFLTQKKKENRRIERESSVRWSHQGGTGHQRFAYSTRIMARALISGALGVS